MPPLKGKILYTFIRCFDARLVVFRCYNNALSEIGLAFIETA
jgi:hypothetical protein